MSDLAIEAARKVTGKILAGNPHMTSAGKWLMNSINNQMYRR